jgi:hypothetical protein
MSIQDLGSLGELIAAIATVGTLIYLALQIRQNTAVVRTSNYAELTSKTGEFAKQVTYQLLMQLHGRRLVDNEFFEQKRGSLGELFKAPGVGGWWSSEKRWYSTAFQEYVDREFCGPAA